MLISAPDLEATDKTKTSAYIMVLSIFILFYLPKMRNLAIILRITKIGMAKENQ